jgi:NAD(P)-dependent dehydrogenase (short-subunit alcohol dehydrogenase family)
MDLDGTVAIITGGASGLGEGTSRRLREEGCTVLIVDRDENRGTEVAHEIGAHFMAIDVANPDQAQRAVDSAVNLGELRALVNCAGVARASRTVSRSGKAHELDRFEFVLRVNLIGTFNMIRVASAAMSQLPEMPSGDRGAIVNTASAAAFDGQVGQSAYAASKGGVVSMTLPIARDLAIHGIRINTISPGTFDTPIFGKGDSAEQFKSRLASSLVHPVRAGSSDEFASLAVELLTNSYMNGAVVRLDGAARLPKELE